MHIRIEPSVIRYLRLHSTAGGGLNGAHSCLVHPSQLAGMWNEIWTNSWPLTKTPADLPEVEPSPSENCWWIGGVEFSPGLRDSPSPAYKICKKEGHIYWYVLIAFGDSE